MCISKLHTKLSDYTENYILNFTHCEIVVNFRVLNFNSVIYRSPLLKLLARHRKSIFGRGFSGELDSSSNRNTMYLEVIISTCLYYMRSYYPNLGQTKLTHEEIRANRQVCI